MSKIEKHSICSQCGANLPNQARFCPGCGAKVKAAPFKKWWFWTILVVSLILAVLLIVVIFMSSDKEAKIEIASEPSTVIVTSEQTAPTYIEETVEESTIGSEEETIPVEYEFALRKAESCSEVMHMSKNGIYNELTAGHGEIFSEEAVQYAIDNLNVDWNKNAVACAKDYSEAFHMSKQRIYNQLKADGEYGEGFTPEEAQYAVDTADINWEYNAAFKALRYQKEWHFPSEQIYAMLVIAEEFTEEEARFANDLLK